MGKVTRSTQVEVSRRLTPMDSLGTGSHRPIVQHSNDNNNFGLLFPSYFHLDSRCRFRTYYENLYFTRMNISGSNIAVLIKNSRVYNIHSTTVPCSLFTAKLRQLYHRLKNRNHHNLIIVSNRPIYKKNQSTSICSTFARSDIINASDGELGNSRCSTGQCNRSVFTRSKRCCGHSIDSQQARTHAL